MEVSSAQEPKTDLAALKLCGITYNQEYEFIDFRFQAGMDDYMEIIFDIPEENLEWLWYHSEFSKAEKIELNEENKKTILIDGKGDKWKEIKNISKGWYSETRVNNHDYCRILVTHRDNKYRCYINWNEM